MTPIVIVTTINKRNQSKTQQSFGTAFFVAYVGVFEAILREFHIKMPIAICIYMMYNQIVGI